MWVRCWWFATAVAINTFEWHHCGQLQYRLLSNATPIFHFRNAIAPRIAVRLREIATPRLLPSLQPGSENYRTSRTAFFGVSDEQGYGKLEKSLLPNLPPREAILEEVGELLVELRNVNWQMLGCAKHSSAHPLLARLIDSISNDSFAREGLQVARYAKGELYGLHLDDDKDEDGLDNVGRVATMLHYLSSPGEGGQTIFPALKPSATKTHFTSDGSGPSLPCDLVGARKLCKAIPCSALVTLDAGRSCELFCAENSLVCKHAWTRRDGKCPQGKHYASVGELRNCTDIGDPASTAICQCVPPSGAHRVYWDQRLPRCSGKFRKQHPRAPRGLDFCCSEDVLSVEAVQGDVLLFFPRHSFPRHVEFPKHTQQLLWHGACPVVRGEKWVAQQWIVNRTKPWKPMAKPKAPPKEWKAHFESNGQEL